MNEFNVEKILKFQFLFPVTYEPMNTSGNNEMNALAESPMRRCQARVMIQVSFVAN